MPTLRQLWALAAISSLTVIVVVAIFGSFSHRAGANHDNFPLRDVARATVHVGVELAVVADATVDQITPLIVSEPPGLIKDDPAFTAVAAHELWIMVHAENEVGAASMSVSLQGVSDVMAGGSYDVCTLTAQTRITGNGDYVFLYGQDSGMPLHGDLKQICPYTPPGRFQIVFDNTAGAPGSSFDITASYIVSRN